MSQLCQSSLVGLIQIRMVEINIVPSFVIVLLVSVVGLVLLLFKVFELLNTKAKNQTQQFRKKFRKLIK